MTSDPYPNIDAPAWTILLRADQSREITQELAVRIVGPELAAPALTQLQAHYLLEEGRFTPLAETIRRWNRKGGVLQAPPEPASSS